MTFARVAIGVCAAFALTVKVTGPSNHDHV